GEAVCVALDQVYTLILQEPVVVGVLNPAVSGGADSGKVLVPKTHDRLALLHSGGLDYSHGIRHHVVGVSTVGGHHSGGGHDLLEIVHRIDHQDHVTHISGLAIRIHCHQGEQITHSSRGQVGHGHRSLD